MSSDGLVKENANEIKLDNSNKVTFPGFPYSFEALNEKILVVLDAYKSGYECPTCKGKGTITTKEGREDVTKTCSACEGKTVYKGGIIIPETAKILASSGVVVSMGRKAQQDASFKVGDRVVFGYHSGSMLPNKVGAALKQMDWYQVWLRVEGADELAAFDFIAVPED